MMMIIVDYAMGNLHSVIAAFERMGMETVVSSDPSTIENADFVVLPGVGSFGDAMEKLESSQLITPLLNRYNRSKPILGICLGMQLLFEASEESPHVKGLSLVKGFYKRIVPTDQSLKVPHMGWNKLQFMPSEWDDIPEDYVYFVHSYVLDPLSTNSILSTADYGQPIPAMIKQGCLGGFQFHPEKSGPYGEMLLKKMIDELIKESRNETLSRD